MHDVTTGSRRGGQPVGSHPASGSPANRNRVLREKKAYHYTESGLNNVWLLNGFTYHDTPYGKAVAIADTDGLHKVIAARLVHHKPQWTGAEFRFIRKELDMSQSGLAAIFGKDVQSVARWEKSGRVPKMADRFLRAVYREHAEGNATIRKMVERLNEMDQHEHQKMTFEQKGQWRACA